MEELFRIAAGICHDGNGGDCGGRDGGDNGNGDGGGGGGDERSDGDVDIDSDDANEHDGDGQVCLVGEEGEH